MLLYKKRAFCEHSEARPHLLPSSDAACTPFPAAFQTWMASVAHESLVHPMAECPKQAREALVVCRSMLFGQEFSLRRRSSNEVWRLHTFEGPMNGIVLLKAGDLNIWTPPDVSLSLFLSLVNSVVLTSTQGIPHRSVLLKTCIF